MAVTARKPVFSIDQKILRVAQSSIYSNNTKVPASSTAIHDKLGHGHKQLEAQSLRPYILASSPSSKTSEDINLIAKHFHIETYESRSLSLDIKKHASFMNVSVGGHYVFLFTAIVNNSSRQNSAPWNRIVIQGFEDAALIDRNYTCCVLYSSGTLQSFPMLRKVQWYRPKKLGVRQFICPNWPKFDGDSPVRVKLSTSSSCHGNYDAYVRAEFAYRHVKQMAVCSKIAYGKLPAEDIISWFEVHKRLGVTKVLTYTYKLNKKAMRVLRHYEKEGMAEVVAFALPPHVPGSRGRAIGTKNSQAYNDEQLAVFDCLERLKGYTFIATIDFDEYLIPTRDSTLIEMMDRLLLHRPHTAGFKFYVKLHVTSWEPTDNTTTVKIGRYLNRTEALPDRMKHVVLPNRLGPGGLGTHSFTPRAGYKKYYAPLQIGTIHHFRPCRKEWLENNSSICFKRPRYKDDAVAKLYRQVENNIFNMTSYLDV